MRGSKLLSTDGQLVHLHCYSRTLPKVWFSDDSIALSVPRPSHIRKAIILMCLTLDTVLCFMSISLAQ